RALVHGAAGAVGQALLVLGKLAGLELWGTARGARPRVRRHADRLSTRRLRSRPAGRVRRRLRRRRQGRLWRLARGAQARRPALRLWLHGGCAAAAYPARKHTRIYSINLMRARHPSWFKQDLERLFGLLATALFGHGSRSESHSIRWLRLTAVSRRE